MQSGGSGGGLIGEINPKVAFSLLNHLLSEIPEYMTIFGHDRSQVKGRCMSTKKIDFEAMSFEDLWSLHEQISQILAVRITSEKRELERRLAVLNRSRGVIETADGESARSAKANDESRRKYPRVLPKYRNPQTSETWSGRGKQPRWLVAAIKTGRTIEEFEIGGSGASRSRRQRA